jgi:glycosyltransferase involved in cell wall biosynthesis
MPDPSPARRRRPVAVLAHSYYDEDPRVRRQAEALAAAGRPVDVYALRRPGDAPEADLAGVRIHRLDVQRHQGAGLLTYLMEYAAFFVRATLALVRAYPRRHFALVQVATLPDWLVFAGLPLRLVGVPLLLDLHESMPAFFASRFPGVAKGPVRGLLNVAERLSVHAASHCLIVNDALRDRLIAAGLPAGRIDVVPNAPAMALFDPTRQPPRRFMEDGVLRLVYAGALTPTYELAVALDALSEVRRRRPELAVRLDVYGRGDSAAPLTAQADRLGLLGEVTFHGRIPIEAVPAAIARADLGLAPTRRDAFTEASLSTKIFEYAAMGRPVVASRLPLVERAFPPDRLWPYEPGDPASLADAILAVVADPETRDRRVEAMRSLVAERSWEVEAVRYLAIVDRLAADRPRTADRRA